MWGVKLKISYSFDSTKDLSDLKNGESLLDILLSNGLIIEKSGAQEPIRESFNIDKMPEMWKGSGIDGGCSTCYFLFKGQKDIKFSGMVIWELNLHPNSKALNHISLWLNIPKKYDIKRLLQLGDDIFTWSRAEYGYITENSKILTPLTVNIQDGLTGLMWVNYFGPSYISETDFHIPDDYVTINHGVRIMLSETPDDDLLRDSNFLESTKNKFGAEWFWDYPVKHKRKKPILDKSEIIRKYILAK